MPIVFIHGVPDTTQVWDPLVVALAERGVDTSGLTRVTLPAFDTPVPDGFGCTKEAYADLVVAQIEALGTPVDLVGHDWGSTLTQRVATTRPDLLRSYVMSNGGVSESFAWHDLAVAWQTPEVGEQIMDSFAGDAAVEALRDGGHPDAATAAANIDAPMKDCVLRLYRSAIDLAAEWTPPAPVERPGLVLWGTNDPYGPLSHGQGAAAAMGAEFQALDGGHWVIVQRAEDAAAALTTFWASIP